MYYFGCKVSLIEPGSYRTNVSALGQISIGCAEAWQKAAPEVRHDYGEETSKYSK